MTPPLYSRFKALNVPPQTAARASRLAAEAHFSGNPAAVDAGGTLESLKRAEDIFFALPADDQQRLIALAEQAGG